MANIEDMDCFALDQAFWEWVLGDGALMDDEGFISQPQPYQPQPEALFMYNNTIHSNAFSIPDVGQGGFRYDLAPNSERQYTAQGLANLNTYSAVQYGEAPASLAMTAVLRVNNNPSITNTSQDPPAFNRSRNNKRKFKDHVGCFSIRNNAEEHRRNRKAFDTEKALKVALMRRVGPCSRCSVKKVECQFPGPCQACVKAARDSINLAEHICIRQTLLNLRFSQTSCDFLSQSHTVKLLQTEIGAFHGRKRTIPCELLFRGEDTITQQPLLLEVQDYSVPDGNGPPQLESECLVGYDVESSTPIFKKVKSARYALVPESLPTVKQLLDWIQLDVHSPYESTVKRFMLSLGSFMERYCAEQPDVPMYEMLHSAVTILKLLRCWRNCKMTTSGPSGAKVHISRTVVSQLLLIIKDGIRAAEITLLSTLEKFVYGSRGPGQDNMIPLWTTLWTLILTYRDCMTTYKFTQHYTISFEHDPANSEVLIEASKHMYHILTSMYAALFRTSTPLYLDWREGSNMELLGNSETLKMAFIALRTEVEWFYGQKHRLGNEDARLKDEIIEQEQRLKPKYGESGPGVRGRSTKVVARRIKRQRAESHVVSGCATGMICHFDH